ncbi:MAG: ATP-binding protein [Deltaproteobacteria bacterium]
MWYRRLGFELICAVSAIAILVIGVYAKVNINNQRSQLIHQVIQSTSLVSDTIKRSMRYDMLKYQPERLHRAIDTIGGQEGIDKVRIFNYLGQIIYSSDRKEMGAMVDKSSEQCYACHAREKPFERLTTSARSRIFETTVGHRVLGMINPIYNETDCYSASCHVHPQAQKVLGVLDIDVSLKDVDRVIISSKKMIILFAAVAIVGISLTIALFIQRFVSRPVKDLVKGTERVAAGDLATPLEIASANEIGILARSFDQMTQRLQDSEQELKASEEKYRSLFENDPNPIFVFDRSSFQIIDANIRATEKYGYSKEELLEMSFRDLGDPEDAEKIKSLVVEACISLPKVRHRKKDGSIMHVDIHSCPRVHLGEDVIIANIADISDSIQAEAQLIQASKMATLGEMSAGVAHELNQPLNAIRIGSDLLKKMVERDETLEPELTGKVSDEIGTQVLRAASIINHLREFGRKSEPDELEKVNINKPITDVFTVLGQQLKLKQIKVNLDLDESLPLVYGVSNRLEQVFINLVMNGRDAIEEMLEKTSQNKSEGLLSIRTYLEKGRVVAVVRDNGIGMPERIKEKIFEPFFTTKEVGRGTGLGLSISYGIVKDYEGTIEVESIPGSGTIFKITFPAITA